MIAATTATTIMNRAANVNLGVADMLIDYIMLAMIVILTAGLGLYLGFVAGVEKGKAEVKPTVGRWIMQETVDEWGQKRYVWQCSKCKGVGWPNMKYCPHCNEEKEPLITEIVKPKAGKADQFSLMLDRSRQ